MKKMILILATLSLAITTFAQDQNANNEDKPHTLFGRNKDVSVGWFIGTEHTYTCFGSKNVDISGLSGGIIIDHKYAIGVSGSGWTNPDGLYFNNIADSTGAYLEGGFGRFLFEYTPYPKSTVHLSFPVMVGGGAASYTGRRTGQDWDDYHWDNHHNAIDTDVFFSIEPGIRAELNIFRFMRLSAGVSYRYVGGLELVNTPDDLMNDLSATIGLKFGRF